jgi:hypothetical protein
MSNNSNYGQETENIQQNKKYWSYIYEIKHIPTGKLYVGSRCNQILKSEEDCLNDTKYLGSSKRKDGPFSKVDTTANPQDYQKTVLKVFYSEDVYAAYRQEHGENGLIATYWQQYGKDICLNGYYHKINGEKAFNTSGKKHSEETKLKLSETLKNKTEYEKLQIKNKINETLNNLPIEIKIEIKNKRNKTNKLTWQNKTKEEKEEFSCKCSKAWQNRTEEEKEKIKKKRNEANKIANNKKYKCPYDDYIHIPSVISKYMKKNYPNEKQWIEYTKEEKNNFKI